MKKTKKPYRHRFEIRPCDDGGWAFVCSDGTVTHTEKQKRWLVQVVGWELTRAWEGLRLRSELTIKRRDGSIQDKRTYGDDPRRTKG